MLINLYPEAKLICTGDNHKRFIKKILKCTFINSGSLIPYSISDPSPGFYSYDTETEEVEFITLDNDTLFNSGAFIDISIKQNKPSIDDPPVEVSVTDVNTLEWKSFLVAKELGRNAESAITQYIIDFRHEDA